MVGLFIFHLELTESDSSDEGSGGEHDIESDSGDDSPTAPTHNPTTDPIPDTTPAKVARSSGRGSVSAPG